MKQDINMDLGLEAFLEPDSDFIEDLCQHLEDLVGGENSPLSADGGPAVIQVVMDGKGELKKKESKSKELNDLDSKLLS